MAVPETRGPRLLDVRGGPGAFEEVGEVRVALEVPGGLVVGGYLPRGETAGWWPDDVVAFYDDRLECRWVQHFRERVNVLAPHPSRPLLAVGTGQYDGGWCWEGALALVSIGPVRSVTSLLVHRRHVTALRWLDDDVLEAVLMPETEDSEPFGLSTIRIARSSWDGLPGGPVNPDRFVVATEHLPAAEGWLEEGDVPWGDIDTGPALALVHQVAGRSGRTLRPWGIGPALPQVTGGSGASSRTAAPKGMVAIDERGDLVLAAAADGQLVLRRARGGHVLWRGPVPGVRGAQPIGVRLGHREAWVKLRDGRLVHLELP